MWSTFYIQEFCFLGWSHSVPISGIGKVVSILMSMIGIPLTFLFIMTGSKIFLLNIEDLIRIVSPQHVKRLTMYEKSKIIWLARNTLFPVVLLIMASYYFIASTGLAAVFQFSYGDSLWYSFLAMTTIGLGDIADMEVFHFYSTPLRLCVGVFISAWLTIGFIIIGTAFLVFSGPTEIRLNAILDKEWKRNKSIIKRRGKRKREENLLGQNEPILCKDMNGNHDNARRTEIPTYEIIM